MKTGQRRRLRIRPIGIAAGFRIGTQIAVEASYRGFAPVLRCPLRGQDQVPTRVWTDDHPARGEHGVNVMTMQALERRLVILHFGYPARLLAIDLPHHAESSCRTHPGVKVLGRVCRQPTTVDVASQRLALHQRELVGDPSSQLRPSGFDGLVMRPPGDLRLDLVLTQALLLFALVLPRTAWTCRRIELSQSPADVFRDTAAIVVDPVAIANRSRHVVGLPQSGVWDSAKT
jgi:hypothetical protein